MKIRDAGAVPLWIPVAGRILFAVYFILMGSSHLVKFREHSALLGRKRVPFPAAATILAIIMMVGGGVLVLFDWHKSVGAALLFSYP